MLAGLPSYQLTAEEKAVLKEYRGSEIVRVYKKAIRALMEETHNQLLTSKKEYLEVMQGQLRGLNSAFNIPEIAASQVEAQGSVANLKK